MINRLKKIREENPDFDKKMVDILAKSMPDLLLVLIDGDEYNNHIGTKEVAQLAQEYITNNKGEYIGFHWTYEEVIGAVKNYVDIDDVDFYSCDIYVWANVKYGDMCHITTDAMTILKCAIAELTDTDYPFYPASQRAYCWLKKHVENKEKD